MPAKRPAKKTIAVTGASGYIASRLIERLCSQERVERVLGFDVVPPSVFHTKFLFDTLDVRDAALEARLAGVDTLIHLAFVMDPIRDEAAMRDINVNGSQNAFNCAGRAGVKKVIYTSSAVVYGAHPDNDVPLTEESPLRANLDFSYSAHKLEVEYVVREFRSEFPKVKVAIFRPAIVMGPHVDNAWSHFLEVPLAVGVAGYSPPFQFVHEDDVADALLFATIEKDLDGPYNLAAPGWLETDEVLELIKKRRVDLPEPIAFAFTDRLWSAGVGEAPAGMLHYVMHPWVTSVDKLRAAGFEAKHSNRDALKAAVATAQKYVRVGRARARRDQLRKGLLTSAGLAALVLATRLRRND
ncbi:MAG TPA: NAD-dependent epimerase/dehydratase family protein [Actinomycetota bacterium]|nr:NAD-dependent epimerase/dehydratase family protein [Actinomycetota bacterium]